MEATNASVPLAFTADALPFLALFMAKNDIRHYLNGISIKKHPDSGVYLASTNGHSMAVWHDKDGHCDRDYILKISPELLAAVKKKKHTAMLPLPLERRISMEKSGRLVLGQWGDGELKREIHIQPGTAEIDGTFPDMWRVMPDASKVAEGLHTSIQHEYIKKLAEASMLIKKIGGMLHWTAANEDGAPNINGAVITRFVDVSNALVITMPMRIKERCAVYSDSFKRPAGSKFK